MTELYPFENDHSQYMSLVDFKVPHTLEERAKAALAELEDIRNEFEIYSAQHELAVSQREKNFEDAMSHFDESREDWVRIEDEHGNVEWVHITDFSIDIPEWLAELEVQDGLHDADVFDEPKTTDLLVWGSV